MAANYDGEGSQGGGYGDCMTWFGDNVNLDCQRFFLARRTVLEMLRDRGYEVLDSEIGLSFTEFHSVHGDDPDLERLCFSAPLRSDPDSKMLVLFLGTEQVKVRGIRGVLGQIVNRGNLHGLILILQSKITTYAKKEVDRLPFKVELFQVSDLLINITKHILAPKYEILSAEEKQNILMKYGVEEKQLPWMLETDAFARYYGLEKGQVVKVSYNGGIVDTLETYRSVI